MVKTALREKDQGMKDICQSIAEIPTAIVNEMIKRFVKKCKEKHSIAFM